MDEQKLTDWYPPEVLPGWYLREYKVKWLISVPDYFDGSHWFVGFSDWTHGANICGFERRWRGLAEPPLTDWFDPETPPEREGPYEIEDDDGFRHFAYWTLGHGWGFTYSAEFRGVPYAIELARLARRANSTFAHARRWRGLAVQP